MQKSTIIDIDGIGPVLFERSKRARHLNISVKPFDGVRVAIPQSFTFRMAEEFVEHKAEWIRKHQQKMLAFEEEHEERKRICAQLPQLDKSAARERLVARLEYLSERHSFSYNKVFIRNQKTLWGSCSFKNNISLNMKLAELPDELCDYVILHELVHTRIKSHSAYFWNELNRYMSDAKAVDKRLRKYRLVVA